MSKNDKSLSKKVGQLSMKVRQIILEFFFEHPQVSFAVRELTTKTGIKRSTVQYYLTQLRKEGFVLSNNQWADNWRNRVVKTNYYTEKISKTGLVEYLEEELGASAIILFGSFRKGESAQESDIDIFVECAREKTLDLRRFEKRLGHKIQLFVRPKITLLPKDLLNSVVNGIKLQGYFTIK